MVDLAASVVYTQIDTWISIYRVAAVTKELNQINSTLYHMLGRPRKSYTEYEAYLAKHLPFIVRKEYGCVDGIQVIPSPHHKAAPGRINISINDHVDLHEICFVLNQLIKIEPEETTWRADYFKSQYASSLPICESGTIFISTEGFGVWSIADLVKKITNQQGDSSLIYMKL